MTTYLTTEQAVELAKRANVYAANQTGDSYDFPLIRDEALCNLAIAAYIDSLAEGLPEPDTHCFDDDTHKDVWSYSRDQLLACIAKERQRTFLEAAAICAEENDALWSVSGELAAEFRAKAKVER